MTVHNLQDLRGAGRIDPEQGIQARSQDPRKIDEICKLLEGRGCIVRHGYVIKTWGRQSQKGDWLSSSKPVFSTLLFFALQEGKLDSVHTPIKRFGWAPCPKDETMTFHHLANMISGYARRFMERHLPFWEMIPQDELLTGEADDGEVFTLPGKIYAIYLPHGGRAMLDLTGCPGNFTTRWYNPREGVFQGDAGRLAGGKQVDLPAPPRETAKDWALLVTWERARRTADH
jgi:hypothetical protein